jgi:hypothetical protein
MKKKHFIGAGLGAAVGFGLYLLSSQTGAAG